MILCSPLTIPNSLHYILTSTGPRSQLQMKVLNKLDASNKSTHTPCSLFQTETISIHHPAMNFAVHISQPIILIITLQIAFSPKHPALPFERPKICLDKRLGKLALYCRVDPPKSPHTCQSKQRSCSRSWTS
mmetsp:Transcript_30295/g.62302  ORF Transcript_30295/g.62302 Transcript_30295/m.62302 type:complete len:132 (+) Transcript_30295:146-541(+)